VEDKLYGTKLYVIAILVINQMMDVNKIKYGMNKHVIAKYAKLLFLDVEIINFGIQILVNVSVI